MKRVYTYTSATAVAASCAITDEIKITQIDIHFNTAPTTSEALTMKLNSNAGATYDTLLYSVDPSVLSITDIHMSEGGNDSPLPVSLVIGDSLDIAYPNTDTKTVTVSVYYEV